MKRQMLAKLSFLLLLGFATANVAVVGSVFPAESYETSVEEDGAPEGKEPCEKGSYFNGLSGECEFCSECKDFMYIRKECTATTNTQCGWCGSRTIVKNEDFEKKCKTFSMFQEFRKKLIHDFKAKHPTYDSVEDKEFEVVENGKVIVNLDRPDLDDEDKMDLSLAAEDDFMKKPLKDKKLINFPSEELTSEEINEEIKAKEVHEEDIGTEKEESDDEEEEYSDSDELPSLPEDDLPPEEEDEQGEVEIEDKAAQTDVDEDSELGPQIKPWQSEMKKAIARQLAREMIKEQIEDGNYETIEDDDQGTVLEVMPPKDEKEKEELLRRAEEIEFLPLKIEVASEQEIYKAEKLPAAGRDDSSSESSEEDKNSIEMEIMEAKYEREEDSRVQSKRRMVRIAVLSITFVVMCWIILSYREKRRKRVFIIPPLTSFTPEQQHMINRCPCKHDGEIKCYENPMAFV